MQAVATMVERVSRPLDPGAIVGAYEIEAPLGSGGAAAVYAARSVATGERVALKRVEGGGSATTLEIESRLLSRLNHPRVVAIRDHFRDEHGDYAIVMELVDGTDLGRRLWDRGRPGLPVDEVLEHVAQACEALAYVHEQGVVHGDVKPRNLLVGPQGTVLGDFGIAGRAAEPDSVAGAIAGTPGFMAPEVFAGDAPTPLADVYGVAATAWTLLTGERPAYGEDTPLAERAPGVTPELEAALLGALAVDPSVRTRGAEDFVRALGLGARRRGGASLAVSVEDAPLDRRLLEAIVRTAAGVFAAACASLAVADEEGGLRYVASWGAGADEIVGMRLPAGVGVAGAVHVSGDPQAVERCRQDPRFAESVARRTGYVPHTMLVLPLGRRDEHAGVLSILDRRDGTPFLAGDVPRGMLLADLASTALRTGDYRAVTAP